MRSVREEVNWFKRSIDIVTLLILAAAFYFIVDRTSLINLNIKDSQRSTALATWNSVFQQWFTVDKLLIENPDVRPYIYARKDISRDDPNFTKVESYAIYIVDLIDYVETNYIADKNFMYFVHPEALERYFFQIFANSPIVCRVLFANEQDFYVRTKNLARHSCSMQAK